MNQLLEYALKYAALGWKIIPIKPRQKVPLTKHGIKDATSYVEQIRTWWELWPNANIAVACGESSGVYVIDVDVDKEKGVNGYESLKEFPTFPVTIKQITPRGGFHVFYRTDNPPANKNSFRPGIDIRGDGYYVLLPPSIHPNGGSYRWIGGYAAGDFAPAEYPDFMRPAEKAPVLRNYSFSYSEEAKKGFAEADATLKKRTDILQRASLYLAECDPAIQGQGGHDRLLWAAVCMVHGFLLSDSQAGYLLANEYNPRCIPPWDLGVPGDNKDFYRKVAEARKLIPLKPRGWLLEDSSYAPASAEQKGAVAEMIKKLEQNEEAARQETNDRIRQEVKDPSQKPYGIGFWLQQNKGAIDEELDFLVHPPGLLGEICDWINDTALRPQPFLALACSLAFLGTLFGRKVRGRDDTRTNLYCVGVASTSSGKNHAPKQMRNLCQAAGCLDLLAGSNTTGDAAMEARLEKNPSSLFLWDEVGFLLTKASSGIDSSQFGLIPYLMQLYSAANSVFMGREYADTEKRRTIIQPCCSIYGTSTPDRFAPAITHEQVGDGFLPRCLIFRGDERPPKERCDCQPDMPKGILERVVEWYARQIGEASSTDVSAYAEYHGAIGQAFAKPPEQIVVGYTSEANVMFEEFDEECDRNCLEDSKLGKLWLKGEENARKISLIVASGCSFEKPIVTDEIAEYSCRLVRYLLGGFIKDIAPLISSGILDTQKQKILAIISDSGIKGRKKREITRATRWANGPLRKSLLADLLEGGEIAMQPDGAGTRFWTVENYAKLLKSKEAK